MSALSNVETGIQALLIKPKRKFGAMMAQATFEEDHTDEVQITDQPVEQGATISDHAIIRPAEVKVSMGWSMSPTLSLNAILNNSTARAQLMKDLNLSTLIPSSSVTDLQDIYEKLLKMKVDRVPFDVYTGKRKYTNMLIKMLRTTTKADTENALIVEATFRQVITAVTQVVSLSVSAPAANQSSPQKTNPVADLGTKVLQTASASVSSVLTANGVTVP